MAKNLIPEIAKMLGVELNEEFKVDKYDELTFKFAENMLMARADFKGAKWGITYVVLSELLGGDAEIIKLPWKPKFGDRYFGVFEFNGKLMVCRYDIWRGTIAEEAQYRCGWVYRTKEETEAALPKVASELGVEYKI
jgi:hypothetical protein